MRSKGLFVGVVFALPMLFGQSGLSETIEHGTDYGPGSNVPEASAGLCEGVPEDVEFITDLRTGWAVALSGSDSVLLSLSNRPLACTDQPGGALGEIEANSCLGGWSFATVLPAELLVPGTCPLFEQGLPAMFVSAAPGTPSFGCDSRCDADPLPEDWWPDTCLRPNAMIEIYSVSDECITGRIWSPDNESPSTSGKTGAFHAVRCTPD